MRSDQYSLDDSAEAFVGELSTSTTRLASRLSKETPVMFVSPVVEYMRIAILSSNRDNASRPP